MIRLCIDDYCHECPEFKAHTQRLYNIHGDTLDITCEHKIVCNRIKNYLYQYLKHEKEEETDD